MAEDMDHLQAGHLLRKQVNTQAKLRAQAAVLKEEQRCLVLMAAMQHQQRGARPLAGKLRLQAADPVHNLAQPTWTSLAPHSASDSSTCPSLQATEPQPRPPAVQQCTPSPAPSFGERLRALLGTDSDCGSSSGSVAAAPLWSLPLHTATPQPFTTISSPASHHQTPNWANRTPPCTTAVQEQWPLASQDQHEVTLPLTQQLFATSHPLPATTQPPLIITRPSCITAQLPRPAMHQPTGTLDDRPHWPCQPAHSTPTPSCLASPLALMPTDQHSRIVTPVGLRSGAEPSAQHWDRPAPQVPPGDLLWQEQQAQTKGQATGPPYQPHTTAQPADKAQVRPPLPQQCATITQPRSAVDLAGKQPCADHQLQTIQWVQGSHRDPTAPQQAATATRPSCPPTALCHQRTEHPVLPELPHSMPLHRLNTQPLAPDHSTRPAANRLAPVDSSSHDAAHTPLHPSPKHSVDQAAAIDHESQDMHGSEPAVCDSGPSFSSPQRSPWSAPESALRPSGSWHLPPIHSSPLTEHTAQQHPPPTRPAAEALPHSSPLHLNDPAAHPQDTTTCDPTQCTTRPGDIHHAEPSATLPIKPPSMQCPQNMPAGRYQDIFSSEGSSDAPRSQGSQDPQPQCAQELSSHNSHDREPRHHQPRSAGAESSAYLSVGSSLVVQPPNPDLQGPLMPHCSPDTPTSTTPFPTASTPSLSGTAGLTGAAAHCQCTPATAASTSTSTSISLKLPGLAPVVVGNDSVALGDEEGLELPVATSPFLALRAHRPPINSSGGGASDDLMAGDLADLEDLLVGVGGVRIGETSRSTELEIQSWLRSSLG